jgi:hypothetical protein
MRWSPVENQTPLDTAAVIVQRLEHLADLAVMLDHSVQINA